MRVVLRYANMNSLYWVLGFKPAGTVLAGF
jgi:hypothetical protein